ncbi:MAG: DnaJ domain-containing protein [Acaryochloris sp. RU_4_1]|nr:DnaJ domain-containing protein [Acaryochloris sp. RU_4_1]
MSFEMKQGIAIFDCPDHYACLGLAIGASKDEIRKRYFKIARSLHPDSCPADMDKAQASQLLSKLVNPAYEVLSQEKELEEYKVLLRLVGQRATREVDLASLQGTEVQTFLAASDFEAVYQEQIKQLAQNQFGTLTGVLAVVSQLSELNLAYLIRREDSKQTSQPSMPVTQASSSAPPVSQATSAAAPISQEQPPSQAAPTSQFVNDYCRRAEELIGKNRLNEAIVELRDALKLEPRSSRCHSLLGSIYLKKNTFKMAKLHFTQALNSNPQDPEALKGMAQLKKLEQQQSKLGVAKKTIPPKPERKGLFGLFGGKK